MLAVCWDLPGYLNVRDHCDPDVVPVPAHVYFVRLLCRFEEDVVVYCSFLIVVYCSFLIVVYTDPVGLPLVDCNCLNGMEQDSEYSHVVYVVRLVHLEAAV